MAGLSCIVVLLVLGTAGRQGLAAAADLGPHQAVPYLDGIQLIKINIPLTARGRRYPPCPARWDRCVGPLGGSAQPSGDCAYSSTTTTATTIATTAGGGDDAPPVDEEPAATVYPPDEIVIPEVATVDVFFSNGSMLDTVMDEFAFDGVYHLEVSKTGRSLQLTMTLLADWVLLGEPAGPVDLVVSGPNISGINGTDEDDDEDDYVDADADDEFTVIDGGEEYEEVEVDWDEDTDVGDAVEVVPTHPQAPDQVSTPLLDRSRWNRGRSWWARRHRRHRAHPIYINGTALSGDELCHTSFNMSGVFLLNRTMTGRVTTVVITQLVSIDPDLQAGGSGLLRDTAVSMIGTSGGVATSTIFMILGISAGIVLLAAIIITIIRSSRRKGATFHNVSKGYGTIDNPSEAWHYYETFP